MLKQDELGLGTKVEQTKGIRLMNRDGSFNIERRGIGFWESSDFYHSLITMPWWKFYTVFLLGFLAFNAFFAFLLVLTGNQSILGTENVGLPSRFWDAFFLSIQTFTTVGFGTLSPKGFVPNALIAINALIGLLITAVATGLIFARFSRPTGKFIFSNQGVIAPFQGKKAFMFRIANQRQSQLLNVEVRMILALENDNGSRDFHNLKLQTDKVIFLAPHWTVVHLIDEESPLWALEEAEFVAKNGQFLVLISAIDDTFAASVHARISYYFTEVVWNAKFSSMLVDSPEKIIVDMQELHHIERL